MPKHLLDFLATQAWIFAKTYADKAPHEYLIKMKLSRADWDLFDEVVKYIMSDGYVEYFYRTPFRYIDIEDKKYFACKDDTGKYNIINRALKEKKYVA